MLLSARTQRMHTKQERGLLHVVGRELAIDTLIDVALCLHATVALKLCVIDTAAMQQAQRVLVAPRRSAEISRKNQHESRDEAQQGGESDCRAATP